MSPSGAVNPREMAGGDPVEDGDRERLIEALERIYDGLQSVATAIAELGDRVGKLQESGVKVTLP